MHTKTNSIRNLLADAALTTRGRSVPHGPNLFGDCVWSAVILDLVRERNAATGGHRCDDTGLPWSAETLAAAAGASLPWASVTSQEQA